MTTATTFIFPELLSAGPGPQLEKAVYRLDALPDAQPTVGSGSGRHLKVILTATTERVLSGEVLAWLSVWSEVQMICIWSS